MSKLAGTVALVTGGGSGIGLETARLLLAEGAKVAITGRKADRLRAAAETLKGGDRLMWHAADVSVPSQVDALVAAVQKQFGRVQLLVANAGLNIKERSFRELTPERWDYLMGGNVHGAFQCMRAVVPAMVEAKDGLIIIVNSISGKRANPLGGPAYAAAKFALRGLATALAAEERTNGLRVSTIYPGEVNTPILEDRPTPVTEAHKQAILQPEDVARTVLFIATMPKHVSIPEIIITPTTAQYI
jgi:NADP-dependent 3-hydroxy acid dehydrogenase YdfG